MVRLALGSRAMNVNESRTGSSKAGLAPASANMAWIILSPSDRMMARFVSAAERAQRRQKR